MIVIPPVLFTCRMPPAFRWMFAALVVGVTAATANARFSQTLSPANWVGAGFIHLSTPQAQVLDTLIQRDIDSARQGDAVAFSKSFTERLTADERERAGIDRLTEPEKARLNAIVAEAIANRPTATLTHERAVAAPEPVNVPVEKPHFTVHGDVSLFMGGGSHGRSWYGAGFDVFVTDPTNTLTVGVGATEIRERGGRCTPVVGPLR